MGRTSGLDLRRKRIGPRPVNSRRSGSEEDGGDGAVGGGSCSWTPQRRHERVQEIALCAADASPWSIRTSPALNPSELGGKLAISADLVEIAKITIWGLSGPAGIAGNRPVVTGSKSTLPGLPMGCP
ncbi:hypothetical protein CRG98_024241 [Punica granatum]|uniref:Uncharacterized protein n=1 Tax=Punica granatum TaxID=22663 RepID=A0A2I0JHJ3_PUNGR|nr:hypothetical protein CRG98_024241 [Punica granatum]